MIISTLNNPQQKIWNAATEDWLKDKKGKSLREGDIISTNIYLAGIKISVSGFVATHPKTFHYILENRKYSLPDLISDDIEDLTPYVNEAEFQIIGSIHDN